MAYKGSRRGRVVILSDHAPWPAGDDDGQDDGQDDDGQDDGQDDDDDDGQGDCPYCGKAIGNPVCPACWPGWVGIW